MAERLAHYSGKDVQVDIGAEALSAARDILYEESPTTALGLLMQRRREFTAKIAAGLSLDMATQVRYEGLTSSAITGLIGARSVAAVDGVLEALMDVGLVVVFEDNNLPKFAAAAVGIASLLSPKPALRQS